jgi:histidine triad (HIT) family protein
MTDCIICKLIKRELPVFVLSENEHVISFLSLENHPLVASKKHFTDIHELDTESARAVMVEAVKIANATKAALGCDGINLVQSNGVAAGQDVFHFHLHIKPRWVGDGLKFGWDTTVISDEVRKTTLEKIVARLD